MGAALQTPFRQAIAALAAGRLEAALPLLETVPVASEEGALAGLNLGMTLASLGRLTQAEPLLQRAMAALPNHPEPAFRLGTIAALRGRRATAEAFFRDTLRRDGDHVPALAALAALLAGAGDTAQAKRLLAHALSVAGEEPELHLALGQLELQEGAHGSARLRALAILAQRPAHPGAARLLAEALSEADGAAELAARAAAEPLHPAWPLAAAFLHLRLGDPVAALPEMRLAETLAPDATGVQADLARLLARLGQAGPAEAAYRRAILTNPADPDLRNGLAALLWKGHRLGEMLAMLDGAVAEFGLQPGLQMNRALALNAQGRQAEALDAADSAVARSGGTRAALVNRMAVLPYQQGAAPLLSAGRTIAVSLPACPSLLGAYDRQPDRKLRIGLLSGGLGIHPVGWLTVAGIEALPESEFEIAAYSLRPRVDMLTARYRARTALWRDVGDAEDTAIAARIAADRVDILIELGGYAEGGRPFVLHHRPAPVQLKWVGAQFSTTGLTCVDGMVTDRWETPPELAAHYTERLLPLDDGYVCFAPPPYAPPVGPLPALTAGHITFGCCNNLAKLTSGVWQSWAEILRALPQARLVLRTHALTDGDTRDRTLIRLRSAGLPSDRVSLLGGCPHAELLAGYNAIDIALDPFPYTGGLTVCEALWMGVPTVALAGDSFAGRHALSHLSNVGLGEWVHRDPAGYVAAAIARAADLPALAALREGLRERVRHSPLVDAPRFGRSLGRTLRFAWHEHCAGRLGHTT